MKIAHVAASLHCRCDYLCSSIPVAPSATVSTSFVDFETDLKLEGLWKGIKRKEILLTYPNLDLNDEKIRNKK